METIKENVESLVEKVQEMLPHHAAEQTSTGSGPYAGYGGAAQYTSTERVSNTNDGFIAPVLKHGWLHTTAVTCLLLMNQCKGISASMHTDFV